MFDIKFITSSLCPAHPALNFFPFSHFSLQNNQTNKPKRFERHSSCQDLSLAFLSLKTKHFLENIAHHFRHLYTETEASGRQAGRNYNSISKDLS